MRSPEPSCPYFWLQRRSSGERPQSLRFTVGPFYVPGKQCVCNNSSTEPSQMSENRKVTQFLDSLESGAAGRSQSQDEIYPKEESRWFISIIRKYFERCLCFTKIQIQPAKLSATAVKTFSCHWRYFSLSHHSCSGQSRVCFLLPLTFQNQKFSALNWESLNFLA